MAPGGAAEGGKRKREEEEVGCGRDGAGEEGGGAPPAAKKAGGDDAVPPPSAAAAASPVNLLALLGTLNLPERLRERRRQSGEHASANDGANAGAAGESRSNLPLMDTYIERSYEMRYFLEAAAAEKGGEKGGVGNGASSANDGSEGGGGAFEDKYAYLHPNGLCVLGVAPTHRAVGLALAQWQADGRRSQSGDGAGGGVSGTPKVSVEFNRKWEVSDFQFKSKKRKDAVSLHKDTLMCTIKVNGTAFAVRSGVKGHLLELNKRLLDDPTLWFRKPATEGWLAVIQLLHAKQTKEISEETHSLDEFVAERESVLDGLLP